MKMLHDVSMAVVAIALVGLVAVTGYFGMESMNADKKAAKLRVIEVCAQVSRMQWVDQNQNTVSDPVKAVYEKCLSENQI